MTNNSRYRSFVYTLVFDVILLLSAIVSLAIGADEKAWCIYTIIAECVVGIPSAIYLLIKEKQREQKNIDNETRQELSDNLES